MTVLVTASNASALPSFDPTGTPDTNADLLPLPSGGLGLEDNLSAVYTILSQQQSTGLSLGEQAVEENKTEQSKALADELSAIQRQAQNESNSSGGFFQSIGKLVSDVVGDLAHGDVGDALSDAGQDLTAAWNSPHFWSDLQNGLEAVSVVAAAVSQVAEDIGGAAGTAVAVVASGVDEGADLASDLAGAREESFAATAKNAEADALSSKSDLGRLGTQAESLIDDAKTSSDSLGQALDDIASALSTNDRTLVATVAVKG
jgi:hypothetical protein